MSILISTSDLANLLSTACFLTTTTPYPRLASNTDDHPFPHVNLFPGNPSNQSKWVAVSLFAMLM